MIHVDRVQHDEAGALVEPASSWRDAAAAKTAEARQQREQHVVTDLYADDRVRAAIEKVFADKCAYCETQGIAGFPWDVEHFRPKGRVAELAGHHGYYWLAYTWENLYLSCVLCNQRRKDKPRWDDPDAGAAGGKVDQFPVDPESSRAMTPDDDLEHEGRLLLDPCTDDPEEHITFTAKGTAVARNHSVKGETSIRVFVLNRKRLRDARMAKILEVFEHINQNVAAGADRRAAIDATLSVLSGRTKAYAGVARAMRRDPAAFGL
ncbi:MAG: retron system putative HNH endonuclease [Acidimicrobiia bacterium]